MFADIINTLNHDIIDYLEWISDPEKIRLYKRRDKDKDHQTYSLSAHDYTALYQRFDPRFNALTHDQRFRLAGRWAKTGST